MKILLVVTHLLGTGHLARALTLAQAFVQAGDQVSVVSGGMPAPQLTRPDVPLIQLAPLRSDGVDFTRLLDGSGAPASADLLADRQACLLAALHGFHPDVVITELFPFGRRILRDEFSALLGAAQSMAQPPVILSSIRDILAPPSKPKKVDFAEDLIARFYHGVLVHSEAAITPLERSWPVSDALRAKLQYTGFVAPPAAAPQPDQTGKDEIIVSAGGGDVGRDVFAAALGAAAQDQARRWRLLLGGSDATARAAALSENAPENVIIEPARRDFRALLYHAAASVSLCGYNTALDVLQAGCPAVFVPFDAGKEVEQGIRASALAAQPAITMIRSADLRPEALLNALAQVTAAPRPAPMRRGLDGAAQTVAITHALQQARS